MEKLSTWSAFDSLLKDNVDHIFLSIFLYIHCYLTRHRGASRRRWCAL